MSFVIPAKAGIQGTYCGLGSRLRGNDGDIAVSAKAGAHDTGSLNVYSAIQALDAISAVIGRACID